ncbi:MAG: hypothetical protein KatS3mg102_2112 [Planctomycetota bacterium]|nr:MAG: hypothetical protein KatS3mg102_2112 [Planctomycetota bacterium]
MGTVHRRFRNASRGAVLGCAGWALWGVLAAAGAAQAQEIKAPAHRAEARAAEAERERAGEPEAERFPRRPWQMPAITVTDEPLPELREEEPIGSYGQPRWTARRRFPTTRIYVTPEGVIELEFWFTVADDGRKGREREIESQLELNMGLGNRLQLDLYLVFGQEGSDGALDVTENKIELRYALADWGEIWGNPTLYYEYVVRHEGHDKHELKLLLGGQLAPGWHAGLNLVYEIEVGGDKEQEFKLTSGIARTLIDSVLSLGIEFEAELKDTRHDRGDFVTELLIGPSLSWSPIPPANILVTPLFGIELDDSRAVTEDFFYEVTTVVGWTF